MESNWVFSGSIPTDGFILPNVHCVGIRAILFLLQTSANSKCFNYHVAISGYKSLDTVFLYLLWLKKKNRKVAQNGHKTLSGSLHFNLKNSHPGFFCNFKKYPWLW